MDERGYYKRHDSYYPIFRRNVTGTFEVPMIHSVVMIDMRDSRVSGLQYYPIPEEYKVKVKIVPCYFRRCGWKSFFLAVIHEILTKDTGKCLHENEKGQNFIYES